MSRRSTLGAVICAALFILFSMIPVFAFDHLSLDAVSSEFEVKHGQCAAVLLEMTRARIEYVYNRSCAIDQRFPPGSIAKVFTSVVLLEHANEWGFSPVRPYQCTGVFVPSKEYSFTGWDESSFNLVGEGERRAFKCSVHDGHGKVNLSFALSHSCNAYFLTQGSISPAFFDDLISFWKLDEDPVTGRKYSSDTLTPFQRIASAIGEGGAIRVSPLKVAQCFSALYEGTPLLIPSDDGSGRSSAPCVMSEQNRRFIVSTLSRTMLDGTLKKFSGNGTTILGGKTGTGTHYRKRYAHHGWVALIIESHGARYCLVTFVMNGSGSKEAAQYAESLLGALR
ncbi:MAG TPA: penicillin-binding transpeptidase domain-containing protein [Spirochaetota bacterium]